MNPRSLQYCFIGGFAVLRWGEPRLTRYVDLTGKQSRGRANGTTGSAVVVSRSRGRGNGITRR